MKILTLHKMEMEKLCAHVSGRKLFSLTIVRIRDLTLLHLVSEGAAQSLHCLTYWTLWRSNILIRAGPPEWWRLYG